MFARRSLLVGLASCLGVRSAAGTDKDHDRARRAFQRGEIRSLSQIMADLKPQLGGEVIEVELERKANSYVYKLKILPASGRLWEVYVDAATGKVLRREPD